MTGSSLSDIPHDGTVMGFFFWPAFHGLDAMPINECMRIYKYDANTKNPLAIAKGLLFLLGSTF